MRNYPIYNFPKEFLTVLQMKLPAKVRLSISVITACFSMEADIQKRKGNQYSINSV